MRNKVGVIIFSKDRPLQCHLAINSLLYNCEDLLEVSDIFVLYKASNKEYENAYCELEQEFPSVSFLPELSFKEDLLDILVVGEYEYVFFIVDDNVFTSKFHLSPILELLRVLGTCIGFSFRLGKNTKYCYSMNSPQKLPNFDMMFKLGGFHKSMVCYDWEENELDFYYALEVSSSLYRTKDLYEVLVSANYNNPNDLEWIMFLNLPMFFETKPILACFEESVAFCIPVNKVQNVNNNRAGSNPQYSPENLLKQFNNGFRINRERFDGWVSESCHEEFEIELGE